MIKDYPAHERGRTQLGWLDSWHSFSFGEFYDPARMGFGALRVINEDWVAPGQGFGMHGHRDMEILTVVLSGALTHRDSLGHEAVLRPGEVQVMSAGSGIRHAEFNAATDVPVHLLQIWIEPAQRGTAPTYAQRAWPLAARQGRLQVVWSPDGAEDALTLRQDARVYLGMLTGSQTAQLALRPGRRAYVQLAQGMLTVCGHLMRAGDGLAITDTAVVQCEAGHDAQVLVFDLP